MATDIYSDLAIHPGEHLRDELAARGMTMTALAEAMGRPLRVISDICNGRKRLTADTAIELEEVLGIDAGFWVKSQARYDLTVARARRTRASA